MTELSSGAKLGDRLPGPAELPDQVVGGRHVHGRVEERQDGERRWLRRPAS